MPFLKLPFAARLYILLNVVIAVGLLLFTAGAQSIERDFATLSILTVLACLANVPRVDLTVLDGKMTLSNTVIFLAMLLRPSAFDAMLVAAASAIIGTVILPFARSTSLRPSSRAWYKPVLSAANLMESAFVAQAAWRLAGGPTAHHVINAEYLMGLALMCGTYFLVNTFGISVAIALSQRLNVVDIWRENFVWTFPGCLCAVCAAAGTDRLVQVFQGSSLSWISFLLLVPPVYVVYYSYKLYLDKIHTELRHVRDLNELNARVIGTLAMTIEAKDRYTQKHVERVREYALAIAHELGVSGPELEAVRIGAMVHDIGKIAVPEMILAKPGKLTAEEHKRMKTHVLVGVKILEAVSFPFPVTDAVVAHHERWDGNGYPYGLKGEEIPLVGRIVALADGFDAITSDRPYRTRLSDQQAIELIESDGGQHYDPRIVSALVRSLPRVKPVIDELNKHEWAVDELSGQRRMIPQEALEEIASAAEEAVVLAEISLRPNLSFNTQEVLELLLDKVHNLRLLPATAAAVFMLEDETDEVRVRACRGLYPHLFEDLSMKVGEGVSGWVVARGEPIINAPAANDIARRIEPGQNLELNSALSVPLQIGERCIGAITLYHTGYNLYSNHHLRLLTTLAEHASGALDTLFQLETNQMLAHTDSLTSLPNMRFLIQQLEHLTVDASSPFSILLLDLNDFKLINDTDGHLEGDRALREVARILEDAIRTPDLVGRYAGDEFVVICRSTKIEDADRIASRIRLGLHRNRFGVRNDRELSASIGVAYYPRDGSDWRTLVGAADRRMYADKLDHHGLKGWAGLDDTGEECADPLSELNR